MKHLVKAAFSFTAVFCILGGIVTALPVSAEEYTENVGYFVVTGSEPDVLRGDVNLDNEVSVEDAQLALKSYTEKLAGNESDLTADQLKAADVNADAELTVEDVQCILIYYTKRTVAGLDITWEDLIGKAPETQPARREFSIDDICNDGVALRHFAKKFCDDLAVGNDGFFYIGERRLCDYSLGIYIIAALNGDVISDEALGVALRCDDGSSFIDNSMYFLACYSEAQERYGFNIDFSKYICSQKDPNGDYANYLNTLQYYGSNDSILEFAAEHKDDYAGDLIASNLLYSYQETVHDDYWFMDYTDVINASEAFNNRALDAINKYAYVFEKWN